LAFAAVLGAERAGAVVDARVDDARVTPRLVRRDAVLFFEDDDLEVRVQAAELVGRRQPHDAAADDRYVVSHVPDPVAALCFRAAERHGSVSVVRSLRSLWYGLRPFARFAFARFAFARSL